MHTPKATTKDKDNEAAAKPDKLDRLEEQLSFKSRFVLVFGEIDDALAQATCRRLLALSQESDAPITMLISSPGGHVESGDAIHDMIRFVRAPVTTVGTGWVASAVATQTGRKYESVLPAMERDFWMSAEEAVGYGIVSRIIQRQTELQ